MYPRTMVRWGFGLAVVLLATGFTFGAEYQFDNWQFTPSADTEYKVDIYGVLPPTLSKPYPTWVLLQDDRPCTYAGYVPEFGTHRWHLTVGVNNPDIIAAYGNVYCRTNRCAWQAVGQIAGQSGPELLGSGTGEDEAARAAEPVGALSSVAVGVPIH